jgi:cell division protein FtsQ
MQPIPLDVKLMNATASVLLVFGCVAAVAGAGWWVLNQPWFAIKAITVRGELAHNTAETLRAYALPRLDGNFFTLNLDSARQAFEAVPWVDKAVIGREFPNRLNVQLQEYRPVAFWGAEGETHMVNNQGTVFDTPSLDVEIDDLPRLSGPQAQTVPMLEMYRALFPLFQPLGADFDRLELSERGSWRAHLSHDASETTIELGRGTQAQVVERVRRFVRSVAQASAQYGRSTAAIESADLRHANGYALRLRGVTTVTGDVAKTQKKPAPPTASVPPKVNR